MSEQSTRPTKRIDALTRGEFIHYRDERMEPGVVAEVAHVQPYRNGDGREMVAALFTPLAGGEPLMTRKFASHKVLMATEDDVAAAADDARRRELQDDLVALQMLLGGVEPRVEMFGRDVSFKVAPGEVERIAAELALPTGQFGTTDNIVVTWTAPGDEDRGPRLTVRFWGEPQPVEVEHRHVGGAAGGPGDNSAECACGVTYAGFDTHREAAALIERHVADEAAKATPLQVDNAIAAAEALEPKDTGRLAECGCHIFQDPLNDDPEVIHDTACQDWWFTFGSGHTHPESPAVNAEGGESLADRYVVIRGTYESARATMLRFFGRVWCDQYETAEKAGVERFGLTELHRRHWPTPAVVDAQPAGE